MGQGCCCAANGWSSVNSKDPSKPSSSCIIQQQPHEWVVQLGFLMLCCAAVHAAQGSQLWFDDAGLPLVVHGPLSSAPLFAVRPLLC
jgi:hypothetical protein